ncbi:MULTISPECIES: hypothetical protein [unclassified Streptomyces]|uniref:hypothetical protein n=1 Tax=unclassified Streptomyces TaxID=2593676 RepID=UPI00081E843A|nr:MULTISPECIES: hypothetical protein [unclassified Streptomyces]MYZ37923.1 hypothetical protein [Streptomyces sp. SID4917]SCF95192.1 hypothetical protein GA0115259_1054714 [Streptomyces sp. MnatMP-M17]
MKSRQEVTEAFAALPEDITTRDIADATGRGVPGVQNWITHDSTFPGESAPRKGRTKFRNNAKVLEWYLKQPFASDDRLGPRAMSETARQVQPELERMNIKELADALKVTPAAVRHHITANQPGTCVDPFPAAGDDGKRSWPQVRSWLLRHDDPLPGPGDAGTRDWAEVRGWLLRNLDDGRDHSDAEGLTLGERDLIERARAAKAAGAKIPAEWLSEVLGIEDTRQVGRLLRGAPAQTQPARLRPTALARHFGLTVSQVKHFERTYATYWYGDPFPGKDENATRDVEEVGAWLARNNKLPAAG